MSGPKGGSYTISPEQRARIACEAARDECTQDLARFGAAVGQLLRADASTTAARDFLRGAAEAIARAEHAVGARLEGVERYLDVADGYQQFSREIVESVQALVTSVGTALSTFEEASCICESENRSLDSLEESLGGDLDGDIRNKLDERRSGISGLLVDASALLESGFKFPDVSPCQLANDIDRATALLRSAAFDLSDSSERFEVLVLSAASAAGMTGPHRDSLLDSSPQDVSPPSDSSTADQAKEIRRLLDASSQDLSTEAVERFRTDLARLLDLAPLSDELRATRLTHLRDRLLTARDSARLRRQLTSVAESITAQISEASELTPELRTAASRLLAGMHIALERPEIRRHDVHRLISERDRFLTQLRRMRENRASRRFVRATVTNELRRLGYLVGDDVHVVTFGSASDTIIASSPDGESVMLQFGPQGDFHAELFVDAPEHDVTPDRLEAARQAMEQWCHDYDRLISALEASGVSIDTQYRKPPTLGNVRVRSLRDTSSHPHARREIAPPKRRTRSRK